ncbi:MAG: Glutaredoxin [Candidatus Nomurabacteria bacterium GW2011_GWB1_37_5]|uniref:Glutaredoxin n=1 Tax=Candidatus Nomurabacteria bacterium GW2011_GWB1_37_5 TaxID=1618742 RepID=A0A0G0H9J6_9BACT|nr:MAG: Glutaredoxin [Candidatus Nomurabacteria bacterium GW2011_GWB1_37_5]
MPKVTIYSTQACHFCQEAKVFFKANNIPFTEHNVGLDQEKRKEMIDMTGQMGVPVIKIDDQVLVGFYEPKLKEVLGL